LICKSKDCDFFVWEENNTGIRYTLLKCVHL
jgi:hypothetical protein